MITVDVESFSSEDARRLVTALDAGLAELYTPDQRFGPNLKPEHLVDDRGVFLVARDGGRAVGCGALRILDPSTAEVKRMYVEPDLRGRGIGRAVLERLEEFARSRGVSRLVLETGVHQHAAIELYTKAGFAEVPCWGEYTTSATSVCYEKRLAG